MNAALAVLIVFAAGDGFDQTFERAVAAYSAQDYAEAARGFEQLVGEGIEDPVVFFNLANTYYRMNHIGAAIGNYERALHLAPGFDDAGENLAQALTRTRQNLPRPEPPRWEQVFFFWHHGMAPSTALFLFISFWLSFWAVLAARQWKRFPYSGRAAAALGLLALLCAGSAWVKAHPPQLAVAVTTPVEVRYDRSDMSQARFQLDEGDRVRVTETQDGWMKVVTADGEQGWGRAESFLRVGPPYETYTAAGHEARLATGDL